MKRGLCLCYLFRTDLLAPLARFRLLAAFALASAFSLAFRFLVLAAFLAAALRAAFDCVIIKKTLNLILYYKSHLLLFT